MKKLLLFLKKIFFKVGSCFYVGATDVLPEPLSKEDEEYYVKLKEEGDTLAKEKLIEHNLRLVVFLAKKYENTGVDLEDLVSIGSIGLIKGINTFSSTKNIKLATYASRCIDNEILMYLRKNKKIKCEVSIDQALSLDSDGNELHLEDVIGTDKDIVTRNIEEKSDKEIMIQEVLSLKPRDRDIMILRYGLMGNDEFTQKEVAEKLGISQSYISRIEKKVIRRLKSIINVC
ncbi:MAG: RNA polymerase sporulation sigma factor SigK [Bacilli bacterium]|nr:RNA polymerase sporulation sigma factor SigK [Bacilli bacterium]